ncbi:hypothetical protein [Streptomyces sp. TS71-3]|uniref:hypothetical protein n=1 Tax=Streptomyces sp. TS71-3 TaxID=2733862 RepID=UPI001B274039|nr:hypothetical protein [Streptomyces sp. TS71-3]GHJ39865.1 hypothetical protein Sm713_54740 [Streptomyces sp. TS71-3]
MPGTTGDQAAPAGGSPWGQPWGPDSAGPPAQGGTWGSGPGLPEAPGAWGAGAQQPPAEGYPQQTYESYGAYDGGALPPQAPDPGPYAGPLPPAAHESAPLPPAAPAQHGAFGAPLPPTAQHGAPLPQAGPGEQPGAHGGPAHAAPGAYGGPAYAAPGAHEGPTHAAPGAYGGDAAYTAPGGAHAGPAHAAPGAHAAPAYPVPDPHAAPGSHGAPGAHAGPGSQAAPPAHGGPAHAAPPGPGAGGAHAAGDDAATQYIAPVTDAAAAGGSGALPPERPAESTQRLGRVRSHRRQGQQPQAQQPQPAAQDADNQATQYIAPISGSPSGGPVPGQPPGAPYGIRPGTPADGPAPDRQPPSEFDSLFRTQPGPEAAGATQQLPRFDHQGQGPAGAAAQGPGHAGYGGGYGDTGGRSAGRRGGRSKGPLIAVVGIGIVVLGVGAGTLLSGGGGDDGNKKPVSATAPAGGQSPAADQVKAQAVELDKLLDDSNNSREAVIGAVSNIKGCKNLGPAATDLRKAANQRDGLVTRLSGLSVDKLPNHAALTSALNEAWKASAAADNHYASWADQVSGKHGCRKGHARNTGETAAGNKSSGDATTAKQTAAGLWNAIASKYGLTTRDKSQL